MIRTIIALALVFVVCAGNAQKNNQQELQLLMDNVFSLSEVMLHDVANPPAAARFYAYAMLGAYQAAAMNNPSLTDINGVLKTTPRVDVPLPAQKFNLSLASNYIILEVGKSIMPSGSLLEEKQKKL